LIPSRRSGGRHSRSPERSRGAHRRGSRLGPPDAARHLAPALPPRIVWRLGEIPARAAVV